MPRGRKSRSCGQKTWPLDEALKNIVLSVPRSTGDGRRALNASGVMTEIIPKPDDVELPPDEVWEKLSADQRYYYRNRERLIERKRQREQELREWFAEYKRETGCSECDETHPSCIDFHHIDADEKEMNVSNMVKEGYSKESILSEVEKCKALCANCHRKHHFRE